MDASMGTEVDGAGAEVHPTRIHFEEQAFVGEPDEPLTAETDEKEPEEESMLVDRTEEGSTSKQHEDWIRNVEEVMRVDRVNADLAAAAAAVMDRPTVPPPAQVPQEKGNRFPPCVMSST